MVVVAAAAVGAAVVVEADKCRALEERKQTVAAEVAEG